MYYLSDSDDACDAILYKRQEEGHGGSDSDTTIIDVALEDNTVVNNRIAETAGHILKNECLSNLLKHSDSSVPKCPKNSSPIFDPDLECLIRKYPFDYNKPSTSSQVDTSIVISSDEDVLNEPEENVENNSTHSDINNFDGVEEESRRSNSPNQEIQMSPASAAHDKFTKALKRAVNGEYVDFTSDVQIQGNKSPAVCLDQIEEPVIEVTTNNMDVNDDFLQLETKSNSNGLPKKKTRLAERKKLEREESNAKKRQAVQDARMVKEAVAIDNKRLKPDEYNQFVTVLLDIELINEDYAEEIVNILQSTAITYHHKQQLVPKTVTWCSKIKDVSSDSKEKSKPPTEAFELNEVLITMNWKEIVNLVSVKGLSEHINLLQSIFPNKKLILAIYGLAKYFEYQKSQKQKDLRAEITQSQTTDRPNTKYNGVTKITWEDLELALTEIQILFSCSHRLIDTKEDVGFLIVQLTKAIALAPFKLEKYEKQKLEANRYISGDNKNCVRVDKNGNGLRRLWQQQLTAFPLARVEHAEAIIAKYPTLASLLKEYGKCTQHEGEKLLQDIPIRRAAGPLTAVKKIGPELSKKIYVFFTSVNGNVFL